jgi:phospholipid transport system substrate-binding protein
VDHVIKVLLDPELKKDARVADRRAAIRKVAAEIFDFEEIARRSLGRHWPPRSPDERREFVQLMTDLLEHAYVSKLETYSGEAVHFLGDTIDGDAATVKTKITTKGGVDIPVDYRMLGRGGRWVAYDVHVEGVSLVANYRIQFDRVIQRQSYPELVKALRAKPAEPKDKDIEARRKERLAESQAPKPPAPAAVSEPPTAVRGRQSP